MRFLQSLNQPVSHSPWKGLPNVAIIRGDRIHPIVSGNKLYKLLPAIEQAVNSSKSHLISVGGRYSNHLHALAWVGYHLKIPTIAIVMGYPEQALTATLNDCKKWGMAINFINKIEFQQRYQPEFWQPWQQRYPDAQIIYEGGWAPESLISSGLWWQSIPSDIDTVICSVGSGSMLAGLLLTKPEQVEVIGVPAFRDPNNYSDLRKKLVEVGIQAQDINLWQEFAGRGFGKLSNDEQAFMQRFELQQEVLLDPVYTVKTFFALEQKLAQEPSLNTKKIALIHSGGLQGRR